MVVIKTLNMILAFGLELAMIFSLGYYGFHSSKHVIWKYALAIILPLAAMVLWGIFAAPKSQSRLSVPYRNFFELFIFLLTAFLLYNLGLKGSAFLLASLAITSELIALLLHQ